MKADLDLVQDAKGGNRSAFSELVMRHQKQMMRVALRLTRDWDIAEDVVQESFIKAYQSLKGFEGRASFKSWMYQITSNTAKNRLRSLSRETVNIDYLTVGESAIAEGKLAEVDIKELIRHEIAQLPARQQQALSLRIFDDLSFKEIADIMDCPYDTAKANYRHALLKLRNRIEDNSMLSQFKSTDKTIWVELSGQNVEVEG